jgi:hypothetical protein
VFKNIRKPAVLGAFINLGIKKASAMSPSELFGTLVRAGIYTKNGKLRKAYAG